MIDLIEIDLFEVLNQMANYTRDVLYKMYRNGMQKMADLTSSKCNIKTCKATCCNCHQCKLVKAELDTQGVKYEKGTHPELYFMTETGCILKPWERPICTIHICEKLLMTDPEFYDRYFRLRSNLDILIYILDEDGQCLKNQISNWPQPLSSKDSSTEIQDRIKKLLDS